MPERLPIYDLETRFLNHASPGARLVITAPTGSGKSTQIPQILLRHGLLQGQVVILQPRRLATRLLAARVADELSCPLGEAVGYQIRFEDVTSSVTRIRYVTEGILLRQLLDDPALRGVDTLIFDEFHERHLYGDITLAQALDLQENQRPNLRVIVMSATLDAALIERYLQTHCQTGGGASYPCRVLRAEGRMHPVEVVYAPAHRDPDPRPIWEQAADAFVRFAEAQTGDVLVFMPGAYEISQTLDTLRHQSAARGYLLLPLHGDLPPHEQDRAVAKHTQPKIIVATNVAETSITIDGIRLVIDSGLARIPRFDPYRGINTLLIDKISQAAADQRAGRAGRTAPGLCVRLWSQREHRERPAQELPEIKRLDLAEVVLTLKAAGITDLRRFRWLEAPDPKTLENAEDLLLDLGALRLGADPAVTEVRAPPDSVPMPTAQSNTDRRDAPRSITPIGRRMLAFPVHPRYGRLLLAAADHGCVYQAALIAALTQGRDLLLRKVDREVARWREDLLGENATSDFWVLMRAWTYAAQNNFTMAACRKIGIHMLTARQVGPLLGHFLRIAERQGLDVRPHRVSDQALQRCILLAFSDRVARRLDSGTLRCELVHGRRGVLARESVVHHAPLFVAAEVREVEGRDQAVTTLLSLATAIEPAWLLDLFPQDVASSVRIAYDATARRVIAQREVTFRGILLESKREEPPPADAAARLLAEEVLAGRLTLRDWDHRVDQWIHRLNGLTRWCPELGLPPITEADRAHLIEQICHGGVSAKDLKERPVKAAVRSWLSADQQRLLDLHAPERVTLANGRQPKVMYPAHDPPFIALRIQELFGVRAIPRIGLGRVSVLVHILAPNMRPVQITQDLPGFWREQYPRVKQELQRKYPKHEWREEPLPPQ